MSEQKDTFDRLFRILELEAQQLRQRAAEIDRKLKLKIIEARTPDPFQQVRPKLQSSFKKHNDNRG